MGRLERELRSSEMAKAIGANVKIKFDPFGRAIEGSGR